MKQQTMVAMMATNSRMEEAMPAIVVGLRREDSAGLKIVSVFLVTLYNIKAKADETRSSGFKQTQTADYVLIRDVHLEFLSLPDSLASSSQRNRRALQFISVSDAH